MGANNIIQLVWVVPPGGGERVQEIWFEGQRLCGVVNVSDNVELERIIQFANDYDHDTTKDARIEELEKENAELQDRIDELEGGKE